MPVSIVLYVEDDADDVFLFRRALQTLKLDCDLRTVSSVVAAKSYLSGKVPYGDRRRFPMPSLLVTDMTIPGARGSSMELVSWIRSTPELAKLSIVCATGNDQPSIIEDFAKLGVICHQKTSNMAAVAEAVKVALEEIERR